MALPITTMSSPRMAASRIVDLKKTLHAEIPICSAMQIEPTAIEGRQLTMGMPLLINRNHKQTAFAGSLNALCTVVGWGTMYLLLKEFELQGDVVIRRGNIRYLLPVETSQVEATSLAIEPRELEYFVEMLKAKGRAKLDLKVEILSNQEVAVRFDGSYVVIPAGE